MATAPTPPRVSHLLPLPVLAEQLSPTYAKAVNRLEDEVYDEVKSGMQEARLHQPLCDAVWEAMVKARPRLSPEELLEKIAKAMAKKGGPRPRAATGRAAERMNTLFAYIDVNVGRASETARAALESEQGRKMLGHSIGAAGEYLAERLLAATRTKGETE